MIEKIAQAFSIVFQPFFMPVYLMLLLFGHHSYFSAIYTFEFIYKIYIITGILTVAMPLLSLVVLYKWGVISDINLSKRKERILPTYIALVYYGSFYYLMRQIQGLDVVILSAIFSCIVTITLTNIITSWWKISIHGAGISLVAGIFIAATQIKFVYHPTTIIILLLLVGIVGWSRLYLHKHTPAQVYAGSILGFLISYFFTANGVFI